MDLKKFRFVSKEDTNQSFDLKNSDLHLMKFWFASNEDANQFFFNWKDMITSRFLKGKKKKKRRSWQLKHQKNIPIEKISTTHDMSI